MFTVRKNFEFYLRNKRKLMDNTIEDYCGRIERLLKEENEKNNLEQYDYKYLVSNITTFIEKINYKIIFGNYENKKTLLNDRSALNSFEKFTKYYLNEKSHFKFSNEDEDFVFLPCDSSKSFAYLSFEMVDDLKIEITISLFDLPKSRPNSFFDLKNIDEYYLYYDISFFTKKVSTEIYKTSYHNSDYGQIKEKAIVLNEIFKNKVLCNDSSKFLIANESNNLINYWSNEIKSRMNNVKKDNSLLEMLKDIRYTSMKLRVFNVGQGNASALFLDGNSQPICIFDFGMGREKHASNVDFTNLLNSVDDNGIVLLSHYHEDHYAYYGQFNSSIWNRHFIVPELIQIKLKSSLIKFLYTLLNSAKYLSIIPDNSINTRDNYYLFDLEQGNRNSSSHNSPENSHSLVAIIKNGERKILLPGDAFYDQFYKVPSVDYCILAHHGANYNYIIPTVLCSSIVLCKNNGDFNNYHPQENHISLFQKNSVIRFGKDDTKMFNGKIAKIDNLTIKSNKSYEDFVI